MPAYLKKQKTRNTANQKEEAHSFHLITLPRTTLYGTGMERNIDTSTTLVFSKNINQHSVPYILFRVDISAA